MLTQSDLRELATYQAQTPILSVYLNVDPTERTTDEYKLALRQMLKRVEGSASSEDIEAVERFFEHEYDWSGRGVVAFSCGYEGFWRVYPLAVPIASRVAVARKLAVLLHRLWVTGAEYEPLRHAKRGSRSKAAVTAQ